MPNTPVDFINIFVRPPGDLLYYLAVIGITQASFFMALGPRLRRRGDRASQRYTLATLGIVIVWALLMIGALFALLAGQPANAILPPMERAAQMITVLLLAWAFITADAPVGGSRANALALVALVVIVLGYVITGLNWSAEFERVQFNTSGYGIVWTLAIGALAAGGITACILNVRAVTDAPLKTVYFFVVLVGAATTFAQTAQGALDGDYAGAMRLAFLASLVILPTLIYRLVVGQLESELENYSQTDRLDLPTLARAPTERIIPSISATSAERESAQLMRALGWILDKATPEAIPDRVVESALQTLKADIGALLLPQESIYVEISTGKDRVMQRPIAGISLNLEDQPTLQNAIERKQQRPLYMDRNVEELRDLYTRIDIDEIGPTYFQPMTNEGVLMGVLMIGLPYAKRELDTTEQELLKGIAIIGASLLALSRAAGESRAQAEKRVIQLLLDEGTPETVNDGTVIAAWQRTRAQLEEARQQIDTLTQNVNELRIQLDDERSRVTSKLTDTHEGRSVSQELLALSEEQELLRAERDRLAARLREAETAIASMNAMEQAEAAPQAAPTAESEGVFNALIEALNREREALMRQRERLQAQLAEMRASGRSPMQETVKELIERMSKEKVRLELERDSLSSKLSDLEAQLKAFGVEDGAAGLTRVIGQLYEQRTTLLERNEALKSERDALLAERAQYEKAAEREAEREARLVKLQNEIKNLAADREAALKQRDKLRSDNQELMERQEELRAQCNRLLSEAMGFEKELNESQAEAASLRGQMRQLAEQISGLMSERDMQLAERRAAETERDGLLARVEGDRERLQELGTEGVGSLTRMIEGLAEQRQDLERQLYEARAALANAEDKIQMLQVRANANTQLMAASYQPGSPEVVLGMLQELRTPLTSIVGYVELLLNESAGILGEMQRKFLQRVAANISRLTLMIDDLIRLTFLDAGRFAIGRHAVDVIAVIEDAVTAAANQLREKGLQVNLQLKDDLPHVIGDRDAIAQIIGQLLTNAYLASPPNTEISISASEWDSRTHAAALNPSVPKEGILVTIADRGGGISLEDQTRVFARKYKAENPLVQGLGDTGVGLAIAKALVEAHGGAIWVDTTTHPNGSGKPAGSEFAFVLPFEATQSLAHTKAQPNRVEG